MKKIILLYCCVLGFGVVDGFALTQRDGKRVETSLSKGDAKVLTDRLVAERRVQNGEKYAREWGDGELVMGDYRMPFWYKRFGETPADGSALYISMHGGGGAPAVVNDGQWQNQKVLYTPAEGIYFVPRAPTDTWNMWHQEYMDGFLERIIELAVLHEGVNPNKVYIMGYSAGGDGTYQLAPRLADLWAGAAMSAGHPGDAHAASLRNLPFALYMGGQDGAYNRNGLAGVWREKLDSLARGDKGGYVHDVQIYEKHGHWMQRDDTVSMAWLPRYTRSAIPEKVVWVQDDVLRTRFYWLEVAPEFAEKDARIVAQYSNGRVDILEATPKEFVVSLNDAMMDLDKPVSVYVGGKRVFRGKVKRSRANIEGDVAAMRDEELVFPAKLKIVGTHCEVIR